jgi:hypothetical protein
MSGLRVRRFKGPDGKPARRDDAKDLAQTVGTVRELVVEILARMELHRRDRRDIWYAPVSGKPPLVWLREMFESVNNGRHPEFTLPRRIEVVLPSTLLDVTDLSIRIIDTKGIDRTAARADLEGLLNDPHTLAILCSGFNDAPAAAAEARLLIERAREAGIRSLATHTGLLVLPRSGEALASKDDSGLRVETTEDGYQLKSEQVAMALQPLGLEGLAVGFFDAYQDSSERLREFLIDGLTRSRASLQQRLRSIVDNARSVLANYQQEQGQEVVRQAERVLRSWCDQNTTPGQLRAHVEDSLMSEITRAYASTIRATVRREGEWANLSYSHHLGYGARRLAARSLDQRVNGFSELCRTLAGSPDYAEARDLIAQAERVLTSSYEELLHKLQLMGQTSFRDELKQDVQFWVECGNEWGKGSGYRSRVADRNAAWFEAEPRQQLENELEALLAREWKAALAQVTRLFESEA